MQICGCKIFKEEEKWKLVCDGIDMKCNCATSVFLWALTTGRRKFIFKSPSQDPSSFLCFPRCDLSLAVFFKWYDTPFLHIIQYLEVCKSPRRQNRNSCPCTGEDYAASFKCRAQYLRCLTNYHFMKRKKTFQLQEKPGGWVSRQQITNAGCIWTRKRDSVCFPTGVSPHWLLKDVYNNYTNKETAVRLGGLRS